MVRAALFFALLCSLAVSAVAQTIKVAKIEIANDSHGKVGKIVKALAPNDNPFHVVITIKSVQGTSKLMATLVANDAGGEKNFEVASASLDVHPGLDQATYKFSLPRPWPTGAYHIQVSVNGRIIKNLPFKIKA